MILGVERGPGGDRLAAYLQTTSPVQSVRLGPSRGVLADTLAGQIAELVARAARGRSWRPLAHVWASPAPSGQPWSERTWSEFWTRYEAEFGLKAQPWTEVVHTKSGREHRQRVYLLIRRDGTCIGAAHGCARHEYVARLTEFERGEALVPGRHNKAVHHRCLTEGRHEVADAMKQAGLLDCARPRAVSSRQRHQAERTGISVHRVEKVVWAAWKAMSTWAGFLMRLKRVGYQVFAGQHAVVVRDPRGGVHGLRATLDRAAWAAGLTGVLRAELDDAMAGAAPLPPLPRRARGGRRPPTAPAGNHIASLPAIVSTPATVVYRASMPGYDVVQHRSAREAWLAALDTGNYDASWLSRSVDVEVLDVTALPGRGMAILHLVDGAQVVDRFQTLRYSGPVALLSRAQWRTILSDRDWTQDLSGPASSDPSPASAIFGVR